MTSLTRYLSERGPWCCGAGRSPHVVEPERLTLVDDVALCAVCAARRQQQEAP